MCWSNNGLINTGVMLQIIDNIIVPYVKPPYRSALIMDCCPSHKTVCIRNKLQSINCELILVPPGQTGIYQPLDVGVFGVVKKKCQSFWFNEQSNSRPTTHNATLDGIKRFEDAYAEVLKDTIKKAWSKAIKNYFAEIEYDNYESDA